MLAITLAARTHGPPLFPHAFVGFTRTGESRIVTREKWCSDECTRLILANVAGLPALSNAASTIGSTGAAVGSGDDHASELITCKGIIKKM